MLYNCNFIVCDIETGGLSFQKNPIVEIALVVVNSNLEIVNEYETLIKPYGDLLLEQQAMSIHKIPLSDIQKGKDVKDVVNDLITLIKPLKVGKYGKPIMVGHNLEKFDMDFIEFMFQFSGKNIYDIVDEHVEDTIWISRKKWGNEDQIANYQLTTCCNKVGIDLIQSHRALNDTKATAKLFIELMKCLRSNGSFIKSEQKSVRESFKF